MKVYKSEVIRNGEGKDSDEADRERHKQASDILETAKWAVKESF